MLYKKDHSWCLLVFTGCVHLFLIPNSFIHSFIHSFILPFIHLLVRAFCRLFFVRIIVYFSFVSSFRSLVRLLVCLLICSYPQSYNDAYVVERQASMYLFCMITFHDRCSMIDQPARYHFLFFLQLLSWYYFNNTFNAI